VENKTILVIDDAADVRKILRFHLEKKYTVLEAADGKKGLEMIYEKHPDLVILDINMPKMGGIEVYTKISSGKGKPLLPVIILTVREELGKLFKDLDVDGFITKPFEVEQVLNEIETVMEHRYHSAEKERDRETKGPRKIMVIDNEVDSLDRIAMAFLNAGYVVDSAQTAMMAFEKIMKSPPDFIAVKLGIPDISGDLICMKLKQMPRTMDIPLMLYASADPFFDPAAVKKICGVIDIELVESSEPAVLLEKAKQAFESRKKSG